MEESPTQLERPVQEALEHHFKSVLQLLGEDPDRPGLRGTPERMARAYQFLLQGYHQDIDEVLNGALFEVAYDEMVMVKDIAFHSLCEHHLLPFYGKCHVAYVPDQRVIGLSKIPRLVEVFSRRLQVQERLTRQIAETMAEKIRPRGVAVALEACHLCMTMRGVQAHDSWAVTSTMLGVFEEEGRARSEFLQLLRHDPR